MQQHLKRFCMKRSFILPALVAVLLLACATPRKAAKQDDNLDGSWVLSVFRPDQKKTLAEVFGNRTVELQFDKAANRISGTTGCNRFTGGYTADTANLSFSQNRALTKMACPEYDEQLFLNAMDKVNRYRLIEGQLELMQDKDILFIFARKQ